MIEEFTGVIKLVWTMMVIAVKEDLDQRLEQFLRINSSFEDFELKVGLHFFR